MFSWSFSSGWFTGGLLGTSHSELYQFSLCIECYLISVDYSKFLLLMSNSLIQLFKNDSVQKVKFGQVRSLASDWSVFSFAWFIWLSHNALTFLENCPIRSERKYRRRLAVHPKGSTLIRGVRRKNDQSPTQLKLWKWSTKLILSNKNGRIGFCTQIAWKCKPKNEISEKLKNNRNFFRPYFYSPIEQ